ncbi:hypothetical protein EIP91_006399 [Steccherinum ochraceum]|uniref:Uncharacterized protein n=1 Tax=Steccherinum ochraceum TaxID=92696 RepID=A0A4R0R8A6_9APHY|nr:hypothetical protein EIP91_006399 [Steccherinum ochraceum]
MPTREVFVVTFESRRNTSHVFTSQACPVIVVAPVVLEQDVSRTQRLVHQQVASPGSCDVGLSQPIWREVVERLFSVDHRRTQQPTFLCERAHADQVPSFLAESRTRSPVLQALLPPSLASYAFSSSSSNLTADF